MPPSEALVEDVDTLVVDTSIPGTIPALAVGTSPSTGLSPATALGNTNQEAVSLVLTQVSTHFSIYFFGVFVVLLLHVFLSAG